MPRTLARKRFKCSLRWRRAVLWLVSAAYREFSVWPHPLSANLQPHNFDHAQWIENVDRVSKEAKTTRNDAVSGFSSLFAEAQVMATSIGFEHHVTVVDKSIGIHMEQRNRTHIIDCPHIYPSLMSSYTSYRIDFLNIVAHWAASAPCYRAALQGKEQTQARSAARS